MSSRTEQRHRSPRDVPPVGRPRGAVWRALQADGVVWEGQAQLVGDDLDLAARMIVTHRRVVFVRGGELALDIPRHWLRPEPVLRRDGVLDLFVSMPGGSLFDEPMRVPIRMRDGHPAAGHIIAMLAPSGVRRIAPDTLSGMERAREAAPPARFGGFWDDETDPLSGSNGSVPSHGGFDDDDLATDSSSLAWPPIEPADRVARVPSTPARRPVTNAFPITGLLPRDQRKSPWGLILRLGALTLLLATAAALGAGKLEFLHPGDGEGAVLVAPTPTVAVTSSPAGTSDAALAPAADPAVAVGVGGSAVQSTGSDGTAPSEAPAGTSETRALADSAASRTAAAPATEAVIPTPAPTAPADQPASETPPSASDSATSGSSARNDVPTETGTAPDDAAPTQPTAADEAPAKEIVVGSLRMAVETALRAETLPRYGLPPSAGEWVLLTVDVNNESDAPASLAMDDIRLFDRGTGAVANLDSGTDVIASLAGIEPALGPGDTVAVESGESTEALLLYLLPPGSSDDVALLVGESAMDLAPVLALGDATAADAPQMAYMMGFWGGRLALAR